MIVSAVSLGNGSAAAVFGGVTVLDVAGFALTKPFAVIQRASVTSQRLDLAYLRLQEQLKDASGTRTRKNCSRRNPGFGTRLRKSSERSRPAELLQGDAS